MSSEVDPRTVELLEAYREASSDAERAACIERLREHFAPVIPTDPTPDQPVLEKALAELTVPSDNPQRAACEAKAAHILREHFGLAPILRELTSSDASDPPPLIWRDADQRWADAVLSVGEVAILASPGGLGKSTLVLEIAIAAVTETENEFSTACGLRVRPGPVVLVSYEDSTGRIAGRIQRMTGTKFPKRIHIWAQPDPLFVGNDRGTAAPASSWRALWDAVTVIEPSLVVVDPASAALSGVSMNDSGPVRAFVRELTHEATAAGCGVLVVAHDTKAARNAARTGDDPGAGAVAGSATWHDAARGVLYMRRENKSRILDCIKANYGRSGWSVTLAERLDPSGRFTGFDVQPASKGGHSRNPIP